MKVTLHARVSVKKPVGKFLKFFTKWERKLYFICLKNYPLARNDCAQERLYIEFILFGFSSAVKVCSMSPTKENILEVFVETVKINLKSENEKYVLEASQFVEQLEKHQMCGYIGIDLDNEPLAI